MFSFRHCLALVSPVVSMMFMSSALAAELTIISAEFGTFDAKTPQQVIFEPTQKILHQVGQLYGWVIELRTMSPALSVREEYLLDNPIKSAPHSPQSEHQTNAQAELMSLPRRNQVSQRQLVPVDGKIYGEWAIGPNEPAGVRVLQVIVEDKLAASFEFEVQ